MSFTPASSSTLRTGPPATIPRPSLAGRISTFAAPHTPVTSCESVRLSTKSTLITFFSADFIALLIAACTSFAFPVPSPTLPFLSPTATFA